MSVGLSLRQMEYLVAVAETGQISRAALRCSVSQSSMTIALKKLEDILGAKLLIRHAKGVALTDVAEGFVMKSRHILYDVENAIEEIQSPVVENKGVISIGVTETISAYMLPCLLPKLKKQFPNITFKINEFNRGELERNLLENRLDIGIILVSNMQEKINLNYETILRSERKLWLSADHPLLYQENICLTDLSNESLIVLDMDEHTETANSFWQQSSAHPNICFVTHSIEAVRSLVAMGQGITILSDLVFRQYSLEGRRLVRRSINEIIPTMDIGCAWSQQAKLDPKLTTVIDYLRKQISTII
ncbi:LysR family transcriptional regulator [Photobacterium angustum]|uniref:HTH lysR-type domain-containing protein n=1 Tax=Photobacterium angustum TaxID=661 RepID=A0A2S7VJL8_PHOAN|nr:LysR family transcriptional regulator [Photobacterium angustum]PQJ61691.1 hypothetical protein BTO08_15470 [Photobacterium angustum]